MLGRRSRNLGSWQVGSVEEVQQALKGRKNTGRNHVLCHRNGLVVVVAGLHKGFEGLEEHRLTNGRVEVALYLPRYTSQSCRRGYLEWRVV